MDDEQNKLGVERADEHSLYWRNSVATGKTPEGERLEVDVTQCDKVTMLYVALNGDLKRRYLLPLSRIVAEVINFDKEVRKA